MPYRATGDVGGALGPEFAAQGHTIVYGSRDPQRAKVKELVEETGELASATTPADAAAQADIVVLAVPGLMVEEITKSLGTTRRHGDARIPGHCGGRRAGAKKMVAELVSGMGLEPIDVGPLRDARWVEGMLILWINNRYGSMRPSFDYYLRKN